MHNSCFKWDNSPCTAKPLLMGELKEQSSLIKMEGVLVEFWQVGVQLSSSCVGPGTIYKPWWGLVNSQETRTRISSSHFTFTGGIGDHVLAAQKVMNQVPNPTKHRLEFFCACCPGSTRTVFHFVDSSIILVFVASIPLTCKRCVRGDWFGWPLCSFLYKVRS